MFGAFQFQYTMDFFEIKTFGKSGMSHRLMRRFFTDRPFQKKKLSSRWCYLYITLLIVEQYI